MRIHNEEMIELINVSKSDYSCSSVIRYKILDNFLTIRFGIVKMDYRYLKRILEFRPFEHTGVATLSYTKDPEEEGMASIKVRVMQLQRHQHFKFKISRKYISNLLWFTSLKNEQLIGQMIEKREKK